MRTRWPTAAAELGQRTAFREAAAQGTSLKQHCRRGAAVQELDALTLEVLAQITRSA
jgi:hypothetical protein